MKGKILTSFIAINMISIVSAGAYQEISGGGLAPDTYVVSGPSEVSLIPNNGNHADILINNGGTYNLSELYTSSADANQVRINFDMYGGGSNQIIILNADSGFNGLFDVSLINDVENLQIRLTDGFLNNITDEEILRFTNFTTNAGGFINLQDETNSTVYVYNWGVCSSGIGMCIVRSTSDTYATGQRTAQYEQQVMSIGVQNNPKMLLQPMIALHQHGLVRIHDFSDDLFISVSPEYYNAKHFQNAGLRLNSGTKLTGKLYVDVSAYVTKADFHNSVSNFDSGIYGGNIRFKYDIDEALFLRGIGGISYSKIHCDNVKNGNDVTNNPDSFGFYAGLDFGTKFNFESGLFLSPFVGYMAQSEKVVDVHQKDSALRIGSDIGFKYFMDGMTYSYILRAGIDSHAYFDGSIGIGIWTVADKIGGSVSFGILDSDFGLSGKVSADIKIAF